VYNGIIPGKKFLKTAKTYTAEQYNNKAHRVASSKTLLTVHSSLNQLGVTSLGQPCPQTTNTF